MNDEFEYSGEGSEVLENVESAQVLSSEESEGEIGEEEISVEITSEHFIDYDSLSAIVASAVPDPDTLDADLDNLSLESVLLLIVALVLGLMIVRSKT